jgi:hypothetical protein
MSRRPKLDHLDYHTIVQMVTDCGEELVAETDMRKIHKLRREYDMLADEHRKRIGR